MTKYLVKEVSTGTPENPSFPGEVHIHWHGKDSRFRSDSSREQTSYPYTPTLNDYFIQDYGYDRVCDAKRNWTYKNPENSKFWTSTVEIVAFEI